MGKITQRVLALKYRPQTFQSVIGQNIIVETITNSIKANKLPNAYLFVGQHGTGKTTLARLIAKGINCNKNFLQGEKCSPGEFCHCEEINNSKHLDVLEMDAASRTGIDDVRELIEISKYNPTSAKYKVIILDEIHMLSKQAFNGLLKTLEEPPTSRLIFVFASTEIKKIPLTIVSRCQRFDLHRVSISDLLKNLKKIAKIENGKISDGALKLISKVSKGSVRDSLSLLDRALVSKNIEEKEIDEDFVRRMLGIADRSKILNLLNFIFQGEQKKSIEHLKELINEGLDPVNFLNDFLEMIFFIQQKKSVRDFDSYLSMSESEQEIINSISKDVDTSTLILFWQIVLGALNELSIASNPFLSLEMLVIKLQHIKGLTSYEELLDTLKKNNLDQTEEDNNTTIDLNINKTQITNEKNKIAKISKDQIKNITQTKTVLSSLNDKNVITGETKEKVLSFDDLIKLSASKREIELKYDLERVNLIKFSEGKIDIAFNENLSKNFVRNLSEKLLTWTSKRWVITLAKGVGQKTFLEKQSTNKKKLLESEKKSEVYQKFKNIFSDGELIEINKEE